MTYNVFSGTLNPAQSISLVADVMFSQNRTHGAWCWQYQRWHRRNFQPIRQPQCLTVVYIGSKLRTGGKVRCLPLFCLYCVIVLRDSLLLVIIIVYVIAILDDNK